MAVQYSSSILASIFTIFRERAPSSIATGPLTLCMAGRTLLLTINEHLNKVSLTCSLVVGYKNSLKLDVNEYICQPEFNSVLNCESNAFSEYCGTLMSKL